MNKQLKADLKIIGKRVRYWRKYHYSDMPTAAKDAGIAKSIWSNVENGRSNFSYSTIKKISDTLAISIGELLP